MRFPDRKIDPPVGDVLSKVPHVTLAFWAIKILATTRGETGGDAPSMTLELGYVVSSLILFGGVLAALFVWLRTTRRIEFDQITTRPTRSSTG